MKKVYALASIVVLTLAVSLTAQAANGDGQSPQANEQQTTAGTGGRDAVISGENDQRLINPQMNYRERVEMQRAVQKRAAAKRNQLMQAAQARTNNQGGAQGNSAQAPSE